MNFKLLLFDLLPNCIIKARKRRIASEYNWREGDPKLVQSSETKSSTTVVSVQGFGYSGSGAVVDLLREYNGCNVLGGVDDDGSKANKSSSAGEFDFLRLSGGLLEIERYLNSNNQFINDALLHRFIDLAQSSWVFRNNNKVRELFYSFFSNILDAVFPTTHTCYNCHLYGFSDPSFIYFLRRMSIKEYRCLCRNFLNELFVELNQGNYKTIVLDQMFSDMEFDTSRNNDYVDGIKTIVVYRDPRDVYAFAIKRNVEWIPHENVNDYIIWCKRQYSFFNNKERVEYLSLSFEEIVFNYQSSLKIIEGFVGLTSDQHIKVRRYFDPALSEKGIGLWKSFDNIDDFKLIESQLSNYCWYGRRSEF